MQKNSVAVFDFDGTIVSKDTGVEFIKWLLKKSVIRRLLFYLFFPLWLLLSLRESTRIYGFSIIWYIATAYQLENFINLRAEFVEDYLQNSGVVFNAALHKIKMHKDNNDDIVIISGCPLWLLREIVKALGLSRITLIGSELEFAYKGILFKKHCYSSNKLRMAKEHGLSPESWDYGYSDGTADIHWLKYCKEIHVVNPNNRKLAKFEKSISTKFNVVEWV